MIRIYRLFLEVSRIMFHHGTYLLTNHIITYNRKKISFLDSQLKMSNLNIYGSASPSSTEIKFRLDNPVCAQHNCSNLNITIFKPRYNYVVLIKAYFY